MSDEVGEVFITIRPRTTGFKQEAESELRDSTPEVKARVVPNIDQTSISRIKASLDELGRKVTNTKVDVDDKGAYAKLLAIRASLIDLDKRTATANLNVNGIAHAQADLAALDAKLDAFGRKSPTAKVDVDTSSAASKLFALGKQIGGGGIGGGGLLGTILGLGPALIPVTAAVTGVAGAALASFASAGAGIGALAIAYKGATKIIQGDLKSLQTAQLNVQTAQAAVDNAKGPKARATAIQNLTAAQKTLNGVTASFSPAEKTLVGDTNKITTAFTAWERSAGMPALAKIYDHALPLLHSGLKILSPLVAGAAGAIVQLEQGAEKAVNGSFGKHFIGLLTKDAPGAILAIGHALANIGKGFAGIIIAFEPFHKTFESGIVDLTAKFAKWGASLGSSSGFHKFIEYVKENGPKLGSALVSVGKALGGIVAALSGIGASELTAIASLLTTVANFAKAHPSLFLAAGATLAIATHMKALKLALVGMALTPIINFASKHPALAAVAASMLALAYATAKFKSAINGISITKDLLSLLTGKGGKLPFGLPKGPVTTVATDAATAAETGGGAVAAESAAGLLGSASSIVAVAGPIALAIAPLVGLIIAKHLIPPVPHDPNPAVPNRSLPNRGDNKTTTVDPRSGTQSLENFDQAKAFAKINHISIQQAAIDIKNGTTPKPGDRTESTLAGSKNIPVKVLISGDAVAAQKLLAVQKAVGGIPKKTDIRVGSPTAGTVQGAIANIVLAVHGLSKQEHVIKVSAPGGNLTALSLLNISRAARGLPPTKKINISSTGVTGALSNINTLAHQMGLLPKKKDITTSVPGARAAILDMINLDRKAHGLKPYAKIPTSAPGADKAVQQLIGLARKAELIPPRATINTSTPGAVAAYNQLDTLLHKANVLPTGKHIPTDVPGASKSILEYIDLYEKAHHLPISKSIPTSAPGGDHTIGQMIDLARKIGLIPKTHSTQVSTPGIVDASRGLDGLQGKLNHLKGTYNISVNAGGHWSADQHAPVGGGLLRNAEGGYIRGPGGPKSDSILSRLSNGEFVQPAHTVSHYGTAAMEAVRQRKADIIPRFAEGGGVSSQLPVHARTSGLGGIASGAQGLIKTDEDAMGKIWANAVKKLLSSFASSGGGGGGNWLGAIAQALSLLHQPTSLAGAFSTLVAHESGGNPNAVNLTDINAQEGHPSVGLAQVIRGTFDAYAGPFLNTGPFMYGVSVNPLANLYAGMNYGIHTYGSIGNIPGIASLASGGGYRPYATGGPVPGFGNGDTVPAMLTPGEFVLNKSAVSKVGMGILHAINGGAGTGNGFYHAGGPVQGIHYGASGDWVKALAIQARMLKDAFHLGKWDGRLSTTLGADWPNKEPHALPKLAKFDPVVKRLVSYLWGRHGKHTTFDDALAHFSSGDHPMAFLDIMRAYDAGKSYLTEFKGKGKARHRFIPDSTLAPFRDGLRRYEGMYHHDVQALEHKIGYKPENGQWGAGLNDPVKHVIAHALHKAHSQFLARPWAPLNAAEKALQTALNINSQTAQLGKDQDQFGKWGLIDLVQTLAGEDVATALPIANSAVKNRGLATKLNAAYRVADTSTLGGHFVNQGFLSNSGGYAGFAKGGYPKPGWAWAGENGPELVKFKGTERVYPSDQSKRMGGSDIDYERLARTITQATGARSGPLIEHATFTDNTDVQLAMQRIVFAEQTAGLAR